MNNLYKGKYAIGIYEKGGDESCIAMFDTVQEFADYLKTNLHNAYQILNNNMRKNRKDIVIQHKLCELCCVDVSD